MLMRLTNNKLVAEGACEGLVNGVGDPYTPYFSAEETEEFMSATNGEIIVAVV